MNTPEWWQGPKLPVPFLFIPAMYVYAGLEFLFQFYNIRTTLKVPILILPHADFSANYIAFSSDSFLRPQTQHWFIGFQASQLQSKCFARRMSQVQLFFKTQGTWKTIAQDPGELLTVRAENKEFGGPNDLTQHKTVSWVQKYPGSLVV